MGEFMQKSSWTNKYTVKKSPPSTSKLIPHPGKVINIAMRVGSITNNHWVKELKREMYKVFPKGNKYNVRLVNKVGEVKSTDQVFFDMVPDKHYTSTETSALRNMLKRGSRVILVGEHQGYAPKQNARITKVVEALGGGVSVEGGTYSIPSFTGKMINSLDLTSGIKTWDTAAYAALKVKADVSDSVMVDKHKRIMMADQMLYKGRLTVWADMNVWNQAQARANTPMYRNLVHQAWYFQKDVKAGVDPNEYAKAKKKAEKEGKPIPKKPKTDYKKPSGCVCKKA